MKRKPAEPKIRGLRSRTRSDGTLRLWWEPRADEKALGFATVELDADRMAWSRDQARRLNAEVEQARNGGTLRKTQGSRSARLMTDLMADYRQTPHFKVRLKPKTRDSYAKLMLVIEQKWGHRRAAEFDKAVMDTWYNTLFETRGPRMAQSLLRMMSILFERAETLGWRAKNSNPCLLLKMITPDPRDRVATLAEISALLASAEALGLHGAALAIRLAVLQGQRQTDILAATRGAFRLQPWLAPGEAEPRMRWVWRLIRSKRGNAGHMIVHDDAVPALRAALADAGTADAPRLPADALIRDETTGKPYTEFLFNKRWTAIKAHAADPGRGNCPSVHDLQFRDLRRTFGVLARAAGVSLADIGDVLGNSIAVNPRLEETYTPPSMETASRAVSAVKLAPKKGSGK